MLETGTNVISAFPKARRHVWVFETLRRQIMLGEIEPGATLLELELAARLQCSQSTIREALLLLQRDGLVHRSGHRGTRVSELTQDEAIEMLRLRRDMECRAAHRTFSRRGTNLLPDLQAHFASMEAAASANDEYALEEADRDFHLRLFAEARLPSLEPLLLSCLIHNHRYKMLNSREHPDLHHTAQRHLAILDAVERRDTAALVAALGHHIATILNDGPRLLEDTVAAEGLRADRRAVPE